MVYCADGGANRLFALELEGEEERLCVRYKNKICLPLKANFFERPAAICGDLDSVRPEILNHYSQQGVQISKDEDQYKTDFMKCLNMVVENSFTQGKKDPRKVVRHDVAIFGGLGGRADQAFSNLNFIYSSDYRQNLSQYWFIRDLYLITPESIIFCLSKGENKILTPVGPGALGENVGIIPLGMSSTITTEGLEWDVVDWHTAFGSQISTSNHIKSASVTIKTTEKVLFTVEISKEPQT